MLDDVGVAVVVAVVVVAVVFVVVVVVDLILLVTQTKNMQHKLITKSHHAQKKTKNNLFSPRISGVDSFSGSFRFLWSLHSWNKS